MKQITDCGNTSNNKQYWISKNPAHINYVKEENTQCNS